MFDMVFVGVVARIVGFEVTSNCVRSCLLIRLFDKTLHNFPEKNNWKQFSGMFCNEVVLPNQHCTIDPCDNQDGKPCLRDRVVPCPWMNCSKRALLSRGQTDHRFKTFISCYRTPGPQKGFRRVSERVSEGVSEGFSEGFRRVLEGL